MQVEAKANIKNRFDIEVKHIDTGKVENYKAENIVLDQCFTRLVNFQTYFTHIHVGTGTGTLDPTRTQLFAPIADAAAKKSASTVLTERALPTSRWQRQVVINPEELVGQELTEVGIGYSTTNTHLCTHALIEDSEGNPISLVKTDTMVITIYADVFFELGELTAMYGGKFRWVQPLANNQLLSYFLGSTYPTQQFRVTTSVAFDDGTAPGSHGQSTNIATGDWIKNAAAKKTTTPVRRLGIDVDNGAVRGFGLGSSDTLGTFRGQLPIPGVFTGHNIEGEQIGVGDGAETEFNVAWDNPSDLAVYIDDIVVGSENYSFNPDINLFLGKGVNILNGSLETPHYLTDGNVNSIAGVWGSGLEIGIDTGTNVAANKMRFYRPEAFVNRDIEVYGTNESDYSGGVLLASMSDFQAGWTDVDISPASTYRFYIIKVVVGHSSLNPGQIQLITEEAEITFDTAPADGAIITADYSVDYIPKDSDHVLDLQVAIQYGEG